MVHHLRMETITRMKIDADFYRKSLGQYAEDTLTLIAYSWRKNLKDEGTKINDI